MQKVNLKSFKIKLFLRSLNNMAMWFRSDASLLERLYPDMVSPADDGITIGRVLELTTQQNLPSNEAIADNDVVIYRLLHLVSALSCGNDS